MATKLKRAFICEAKLKKGDLIRIHSKEYMDEHFRWNGWYYNTKCFFTDKMLRYCDKVLTVSGVFQAGKTKYVHCVEAPTMDGGWDFSYDTFNTIINRKS